MQRQSLVYGHKGCVHCSSYTPVESYDIGISDETLQKRLFKFFAFLVAMCNHLDLKVCFPSAVKTEGSYFSGCVCSTYRAAKENEL